MATARPAPGSALAPPYYPALTGLRALAAWLVFFYHFNPWPAGSAAGRLVGQFNSGVGLFFVLSGFLIGSRYLSRLAPVGHELKLYFRRRWARIYPLYLLLTALTVVVYQLAGDYDTGGRYLPFSGKGRLLLLGLNALLLQGFFNEFRFTALLVSWSLTVEESFYALAPWLLRGLRQHGPSRLLLYAAGLLGIGCGLVALPAPWHKFGFFDSYAFMLEGTLLGRCIEFLGGLYLAWRLAARPPAVPTGRVLYTCLGLVWWLAGLALVTAIEVAGTQVPGYPATTQLLRIGLHQVGLVPGFCLLFYGLAHEPSLLRRLLSGRLLTLLGKASYAFYLIHAGLLYQLLSQYVSQNLVLKFGLLNLAAVLLYLGVERPLNRWLANPQSRAA